MQSCICSELNLGKRCREISGVKISVRMMPTPRTAVITVMMMEKVFCASVSFFSARKAGIDRNERDGSGPASNQIIQPVRNGEPGDISIGRAPRSEGVGDICLAHVADHAGEHHGRHQQERRRKSAVLMRRTQETEQTDETLKPAGPHSTLQNSPIRGGFYTQRLGSPDTPRGSWTICEKINFSWSLIREHERLCR